MTRRQEKIKVAVVGGTGYTGLELLRLLAHHPAVEVTRITSRHKAGKMFTSEFPSLQVYRGLRFSHPDPKDLAQAADVVFFATPHKVAMDSVGELLDGGLKVIDLSADFRLQDIPTWERWYNAKHQAPQYLKEAVYGLVEMNRVKIKEARLIATPGCYVTAITLALLPLLKMGLIKKEATIIADGKSGVSGAGRIPKTDLLFCEISDNFKPYAITGHRHLPEIQQNIAQFVPEAADKLIFVPHLIPITRGIEASVYVETEKTIYNLQEIYDDYYKGEPFVRVLKAGAIPETKNVRETNCCAIALHSQKDGKRHTLFAVIDNLIKGASGQAVQNMNVLYNIPETVGLERMAILP